MILLNLTGHDVTVYDGDTPVLTVAPSGPVARIRELVNPVAPVEVSAKQVPCEQVRYSLAVDGLPAPQPDIGLIVSRVLAEFVVRSDLYFPSREVRDADGRIIGCQALGQFQRGED